VVGPSRPDQVVFLPGTVFKVLGVETGDRPRIRLRELARTEVAADHSVRSMAALDDVAVAALEEAGKAWRAAEPAERPAPGGEQWFASPPGLLADRPAVSGGAQSVQKGGKA
jgi:hypothetical protein